MRNWPMLNFTHKPPDGPVVVSCDRCGEFVRYTRFEDANVVMWQRQAPIDVVVEGEKLPHVGRVKECGCREREAETKRVLAKKRKVARKARGDETPGLFTEEP